MNLNEIRQLFGYTEWANGLVLNAAENLSADQLLRDVQISHKSIFGTLAHMAGAEWIWLERWFGRSPGQEEWSQWTVEHCGDLQQLRGNWQRVIDRRHAYLADLSDAVLQRELSFRRLTGETYAMPLVGQMQHLVNHSTQHRGQVVGMIRQLGVAPPATDLLLYLIAQQSARSAAAPPA